ncbi:unnamed protein product [Paramecium primaurelia]|uniref:ABC transporter domain-containing protein n=1 Tax=Paramecium primaurelia TaxID=5886 RepID=A0A8S1LJI8_PARPR|nr:unnamed protein product [Paramecium primaurelia]
MDQVRNIYNLPPKELGHKMRMQLNVKIYRKSILSFILNNLTFLGEMGIFMLLRKSNQNNFMNFILLKGENLQLLEFPLVVEKQHFQIKQEQYIHLLMAQQEVKKFPKDSYLSEFRLTTIGFIFQTFNLIATMTEQENVEQPMSSSQIKKQKKKSQTTAKKCQFTGQNGSFTVITQLFGDEQYRVAIARSLANSPQILLFDKPKGDQDSKSTVEDMDTLLKLNNFGYDESNHIPCTMVMVTHNPDLECHAHGIIYIKGKIEKMRENHHQDMNNICTILTVRTDCYKNQFMVEINRILINLQ